MVFEQDGSCAEFQGRSRASFRRCESVHGAEPCRRERFRIEQNISWNLGGADSRWQLDLGPRRGSAVSVFLLWIL